LTALQRVEEHPMKEDELVKKSRKTSDRGRFVQAPFIKPPEKFRPDSVPGRKAREAESPRLRRYDDIDRAIELILKGNNAVNT
jgi:hypothetical protein